MSLATDIQTYLFNDSARLQYMVDYYRGLSLESAIRNAAIGMGPDGKINSHQWRIGEEKGSTAGDELVLVINELSRIKSFEELFAITEEIKNRFWGLGDLWSYDTALRIGFNLNVYPDEIYVQRGVIKGVKKALGGHRPKGRSLPLTIFPKEFLKLEPYQAENFLCIWGKSENKRKC